MRGAGLVILTLGVLSPLLVRAGDDVEPPGKGGVSLRRLSGKWTAAGVTYKGKQMKITPSTYLFEGDKVTVKGSRTEFVSRVKINAKTTPPTIEWTREDAKTDTKTTVEYAVKLEKGELLLVSTRPLGKDRTAKLEKIDFTGECNPVIRLTREKKDK